MSGDVCFDIEAACCNLDSEALKDAQNKYDLQKRSQPKGKGKGLSLKSCYKCGKEGHLASECRSTSWVDMSKCYK